MYHQFWRDQVKQFWKEVKAWNGYSGAGWMKSVKYTLWNPQVWIMSDLLVQGQSTVRSLVLSKTVDIIVPYSSRKKKDQKSFNSILDLLTRVAALWHSHISCCGEALDGNHLHQCFEVVICSNHIATCWPRLCTQLGVCWSVQHALNHKSAGGEHRWLTSDSSCGYCFLSRSVEAKATCCIFWMLVTLAMPTGCGLSIRRLRRRRRTWQPYRYVSSRWTENPTYSTHLEDNDVFQVGHIWTEG